MCEQFFCRQVVRLAPVEDRLGDVGGKMAEADDSSEVGPADTWSLGKGGKGNGIAALARTGSDLRRR